ncbi:MAG: beta-ketoacyl-ACP synthase II [Bacteroidetes bacterium]|nr:beta-ketoacyl-ACP synthase II [Bacteroidota bacterium]
MSKDRRVVITGLGIFTPNGENPNDFWKNISNGKSAFQSKYKDGTPILKEDPSRIGSMLVDYDPSKYFSFKEIKRLDYFAQYGLITAKQAIEDASLDFEKIDCKRVGSIWGTGIGGGNIFEQTSRKFYGEPSKAVSPFFVPMLISDILPGHLSIKHGLMGPTYTTASACASSLNALIDSFILIKNGFSDIIISGGTEARSQICLRGFISLRALSSYTDQTASRPFDKDRNGFVLGEGAACLILEEFEHAKKRNAKIYGEIIGVGMSSDAYHLTAPHPEGFGCTLAMKNALNFADISPNEIDYINAHATSTVLGDIAEIKATEAAFGEAIHDVSISSTKSVTGHLLGAAGAIESIACIKAMEKNLVPPTANLFTIDEKINPKIDLTPKKAKRKEINIAMNNNFGFGGHNCSLIFKKV